MEKNICIITARRGSKWIKDKNLMKLNGKTLVAIALERAIESGIFSRVVISTDYLRHELHIDGIKPSALSQLIYVQRPSDLAADDSLMIDVLKHSLRSVGGDESWVWLLQPTSPFRSKQDFQRINEAIKEGKYEAAISFAPNTENPERTCTIKDGKAHPAVHANFKNKDDCFTYANRSGNFYVTRRSHIMGNKDSDKFTWYIKPYFSYFMGGVSFEDATREQLNRAMTLGLNIDYPFQADLAKNYVRRGDVVI